MESLDNRSLQGDSGSISLKFGVDESLFVRYSSAISCVGFTARPWWLGSGARVESWFSAMGDGSGGFYAVCLRGSLRGRASWITRLADFRDDALARILV